MNRAISIETSRKLRELIAQEVDFLISGSYTYKTLVITALAIRATRLNAALLNLIDSGFGEEGMALARVLVEVVTNCGYLMVTSEKEFNAFVAFPVAMLGKHHRAYLAHWQDQTNFSSEFNELIETAASEAIPISGRSTKDSSWTSESVYKRAITADNAFQGGIFGELATMAYAEAHDYVHGNFSSIVSIMGLLQKEDSEPEDEQIGDESLLYAAALSLIGCARSLNQHFQLNFKYEIQKIITGFADGSTK